MEGPTQDYPLGQHLIGRKIKFKRNLLLIDLDQAEAIAEKVEGTTVKITESNNQGRSEVKYLFRHPRRTTITKTTVGRKKVSN